jgi:hypothetical protein
MIGVSKEMKKVIALSTVLGLGALGMACGEAPANNANSNMNRMNRNMATPMSTPMSTPMATPMMNGNLGSGGTMNSNMMNSNMNRMMNSNMNRMMTPTPRP